MNATRRTGPIRWLFLAVFTVAAAAPEAALSFAKATVLGIVEGVTEFLPVSSTGHLLIAERLMDLGVGAQKSAFDSFTIVIQFGAIVAVALIYWRHILGFFNGLIGRDTQGRQGLINLVVAFLPAAVIGQLFGDTIKEHFLNPTAVGIAWIVGGVVILMSAKFLQTRTVSIDSIADIGIRNSVIIGLAQTLALWPGTSRSLVTLLAALALGVSMSAAVEFSFLLGLITLSAASFYEVAKNGSEIADVVGLSTAAWGTLVAGIAAFASVKFMIGWLTKHGLELFAWYRICAGIAVFGLLAASML